MYQLKYIFSKLTNSFIYLLVTIISIYSFHSFPRKCRKRLIMSLRITYYLILHIFPSKGLYMFQQMKWEETFCSLLFLFSLSLFKFFRKKVSYMCAIYVKKGLFLRKEKREYLKQNARSSELHDNKKKVEAKNDLWSKRYQVW